MDYKIIFFDMDHTLYESKDDYIHDEDLLALKLLRDQGIILCAATGRPLNQMDKILPYFNFDYYVLINGAYVLDKNLEIMYNNPIPNTEVNDIYAWAKQHQFPLSFHFGNVTQLYWGSEIQNKMWKRYNVTNGITIPDITNYHINHPTYNAIITADFKYIKEFVEQHEDLQYDEVEKGTYDIFSKTNNKSLGIEFVLNHCHLTWNDTITFGDSTNDLEMLSKAKLGIAMGNAHDKAKACANYITDDIHDCGIATAIHKILNGTLS
ncbi:MAG: HAD family hydrolase [Erysipelotrichaceae bacterium]